MNVYFDIEKLQKVADDFFYATGIGIYIIAGDFSDIKVRKTRWNPYCHAIRSTPCGRERCAVSDDLLFEKCKRSRKPEKHICHGGLVNIAAPIIYDNEIIGYVFFYSLREKAFEKIYPMISDLSFDEKKIKEAYLEVPEYDPERFDSVINLSLMLIEYVRLLNMIKPTSSDNLQRAKEYIDSNLSLDLSVKNISRGTNISKSVLYRIFSRYYGMTLSEYVNKRRVIKAEKLLCETEMTVSEIAKTVGFNSVTYFRMVFKKLKGVSPLKFRKTEL